MNEMKLDAYNQAMDKIMGYYELKNANRPEWKAVSDVQEYVSDLQAALAASEQRVRELEGALKPFAGVYEDWLERDRQSVLFMDWLTFHLGFQNSNKGRKGQVRGWFEHAHSLLKK